MVSSKYHRLMTRFGQLALVTVRLVAIAEKITLFLYLKVATKIGEFRPVRTNSMRMKRQHNSVLEFSPLFGSIYIHFYVEEGRIA